MILRSKGSVRSQPGWALAKGPHLTRPVLVPKHQKVAGHFRIVPRIPWNLTLALRGSGNPEPVSAHSGGLGGEEGTEV